jgi:DNA-binding transcriptional ArsR family regulator
MAELYDALKSLSDDTRFKIIRILLEHDYCVGALAKRIGISESAVSQHLKVLRESGLIKGDKRGYYTHYFVDRDLLKQIGAQLIALANKSQDVPVRKKKMSNQQASANDAKPENKLRRNHSTLRSKHLRGGSL